MGKKWVKTTKEMAGNGLMREIYGQLTVNFQTNAGLFRTKESQDSR